VPGIFSIMDISRWALHASSRQLDTVSHNTANVNTEGYSRQEVVLATRIPEYTREGWYGHGVKTVNVIQHVDALLLQRITEKISDQNTQEARLSQLKRLEAMANEASESALGNDITAFFNAWQDLSNNPQSTAVREVLNETASNLVSRLHDIMRDLSMVERDLDGYIGTAVGEANQLCLRIAELNSKIVAAEVSGKSANDFRDERQRLINQLSELMPIQWFEDARGSITIIGGTGKTLVQDDVPQNPAQVPLGFEEVSGYEHNQLVWRMLDMPMDSHEITGGKIGAWLKVRDEDIPGMKDFMDSLARTIVSEVNRLHTQGAGLVKFSQVTGTYEALNATTAFNDPNNTLPFADMVTSGTVDIWLYRDGARTKYTVSVSPDDTLTDVMNNINALTAADGLTASIVDGDKLALTADSGTEFAFANDNANLLAALGINTYFTGYNAHNIELNSRVVDDSGLIAAGRLLADGEHAVGNNTNALDLADLKDADTMTGGTETFNEALISWASQLGSEVSATDDNLKFANMTFNQLQNLRDDVSAVSLDEEMVLMIKFQRAYQMAAKMISVSDQLLLTVLETKR